MSDERDMKPVNLNKALYSARTVKRDPAYRELSKGLEREIFAMLKNPDALGISCCIEGCCVSWCCIQIS